MSIGRPRLFIWFFVILKRIRADMNLHKQKAKFWEEIADSSLCFLVENTAIKAYIQARFLKLMQWIAAAREDGHSSMIYFDLLEKIAFKIIEVIGVEQLMDAYSTEAGWLKTEIKNTLNMICFDAYEVGLEKEENQE